MKNSLGSPEWQKLLTHAVLLQEKIPAAILVGGTASALHAQHRFSFDHDHVLQDLEHCYEKSVAALESLPGWKTRRRIKGKLILGELDHVQAGLRNLRRRTPLESMEISVAKKQLRLPTLAEMLRIKSFLTVDRNATRDYLDVAALSHHLGLPKSVEALKSVHDLYAGFVGEGGDMLTSIVVKLAAPDPYDLSDVDLEEYKGLVSPWDNWRAVEQQCRELAKFVVSEGI